jgi:hypothetical protein
MNIDKLSAQTGLSREAFMCIKAMWDVIDDRRPLDGQALDLIAYLIGSLMVLQCDADWKRAAMISAVQEVLTNAEKSGPMVLQCDADWKRAAMISAVQEVLTNAEKSGPINDERAAIFIAALEKSGGSQ